ncbi:extensin family protein [Defluviimonas aestuarii]|uniref:extensin-like domain-containing protein n=1 Tax=Albidovulum aestuarii TaxID=1130726 RepID=UPI00249B64A4|nr:extensin family protein [Defluviimonas aestuarii]MDI3336769.1 extensin family protein [Defluviimonas aestuarii]
MTRRVAYRLSAALAALLAFAQAGSANAPEISPRPMPRPVLTGTATETVVSPLAAFAPEVSLRPVPRPTGLVAPERVERAAFRTQPLPEVTTGRKGALCGDLALKGKTIPPIKGRLNGCGFEDGVSLISVSGVALTQPAAMDCTTAKALKQWVDNGVKPAIGKKGGGVAALQVAASYACRGRNNVKGAKVSEHGKGRAVDISAILLANGTAITVEKGWGSKSYGKSLARMRKAACGPFNTVLGPGSDRHHHDHFHLDTARGRGAYCK